MECHTVFSSWFSYYWKIIDLSYYKCYVLSADILARGMPNERQTILLRMNNVDNQLLIFYREKGKLGCLWCGDVEKIHSRYSTISLSSLEVLLSTLIGSLVHRRYALSLQENLVQLQWLHFLFWVGVFLTFIWEGLLERKSYQPAVCEIDIKPV